MIDEQQQAEADRIKEVVAIAGAHLIRVCGINPNLVMATMAAHVMAMIANAHGGDAAQAVFEVIAQKLAHWPSPHDDPLATMKPQGRA